MTRPRRLYTTTDGKFYYLIDGKKKFVKVPAGISQKQVAKINIRNIVNAPTTKRIKRRRKRIEPAYGAKVGSALAQSNTGGLPIYFFKPKKQIPTLQEQAETSADTTIDKLSKAILKLVPSSTKIEPKIETPMKTEKIEPTITQTKSPEDILKEKFRQSQISGKMIDFTSSPPSPPSVPSTPISMRGIFDRYNENTLQTDIKGKQDLPTPSPASTPLPSPSPKGGEPPETSGAEESKTNPSEVRLPLKGTEGGGAGDGLYNDEIEKIVKKRIKNYVPVIASDEINQLPRYVARGDKRFGFVINTNPSTSDGSGNDGYRTGHWRAVYINNEDDYPTVEYFDPLAEGKMPPELITICRKIAIKMNPSMMFKYKQNMLRRQSKVTSNCGHHAIKFLDDRFNGVPYADATGYTEYMEKHSSPPDDSQDGEKDISKYIKKYESYI